MAEDKGIQKETLKLQQKQLDLQMRNADTMSKAVDKGLPILDKYLEKKFTHIEGPKVKWSIVGFIGLLFIIVIGTGFLVYVGKLDSSNFTFLLGTLIGGAITVLGDILLPGD